LIWSIKNLKKRFRTHSTKMVNWTKENMESAIEAVQNGTSQRKAAFTFDVPLMTLNDKINKKYDGDQVGSPTRLGTKCEALLVTLILFMSDIGMALKKSQVLETIKYYLVETGETNLFENNKFILIIHFIYTSNKV